MRGDRVALMMPNVPQYPIAVAAVLRAGFVVVNVDPLYTPRELEHQLKDSVCQGHRHHRNFAATLQACIANTPVQHVVLCAMGDRLGLLKGLLGQLRGAQRKSWCRPTSFPAQCASTTRWRGARACS